MGKKRVVDKKQNTDRFDEDYEEAAEGQVVQEEGTEQPKQKKMIGDILDTILEHPLESNKAKQPLFAHFAKPLKDLKRKNKKLTNERIQKKAKFQEDHVGHRKPMAGSDKTFERNLKIGCVKGVVKVFNAIINYQKNNQEE